MKIASILLQCKKTAFQVTRDREKLCEQVATGKDSKGKPLAEKDLTKVWQLASHMFTSSIGKTKFMCIPQVVISWYRHATTVMLSFFFFVFSWIKVRVNQRTIFAKLIRITKTRVSKQRWRDKNGKLLYTRWELEWRSSKADLGCLHNLYWYIVICLKLLLKRT